MLGLGSQRVLSTCRGGTPTVPVLSVGHVTRMRTWTGRGSHVFLSHPNPHSYASSFCSPMLWQRLPWAHRLPFLWLSYTSYHPSCPRLTSVPLGCLLGSTPDSVTPPLVPPCSFYPCSHIWPSVVFMWAALLSGRSTRVGPCLVFFWV